MISMSEVIASIVGIILGVILRPPLEGKVEKHMTKRKLTKLINDADKVKKTEHASEEFDRWEREVTNFLRKYFGEDSKYVKEFEKISYIPILIGKTRNSETSIDEEEYEKNLKRAWKKQKDFLRSLKRKFKNLNPIKKRRVTIPAL